MRSTIKPALLVAAICALALTAAWADVPRNMNVQGRLTDSGGDPVAPGLKIFTFKIFDAETNGTEIWPAGTGENQTLSTDGEGLWHANVGANIALTDAVFADTSRWLEVTVDDGINPAETLPRIKLNTNPWAHQAVNAAHADNAATAGHATTADQAGDASTLGGQQPADFAPSHHTHAPADISPQGDGSGLDADMLDGSELTDIQAEIDADIANHSSSPDHDMRYVNVSGDVMAGLLEVPELQLGNSGIDGSLELYQGGSGTVVVRAETFGSLGGALFLREASGSTTFELTPDASGSGGYMAMMGPNGYLEVDGNYAGTGNPSMSLTGSQSTMIFSTNDVGTQSVRLPRNAIDTAEIKDEPGIASANGGQLDPFTSTMQDIETVSITTPAGGYIVVEGVCTGREYNTVGKAQGWVQIDETSGGSVSPSHAVFFGLANHATIVGYNAFPVYVSRVYYRSAGTYTFRMEGQEVSGNTPGATVSAVNATLRATYYPTSYGSVATVVSAAETGEFPSATAVAAGSSDPLAPAGSETLYEVDLRDLELKAARARIEAERAERELMEARLNNGQNRPAGNPEQ